MTISTAITLISAACLCVAALWFLRKACTDLGWYKAPDLFSLPEKPLLPAWAVIVAMVVLSRVLIYVAGTRGVPSQSGIDDPLLSFIEHWRGADTEHFVRIATYGYEPGTPYANRIVFYPLFPLLMRAFSVFTGGNVELAGIAVSNLAFMGACLLLYMLAAEIGLSRREGLLAIAIMIVAPFSMFFQKCYTESLFLMLTVGCALACMRKKWFFAGLAGFLAALTRTQGVLCLAMALYAFLRAHKGQKFEKHDLRALWLLLIPLGYVCYLLLNLTLYGNAFAYMAYERAAPWYQGVDYFFNNVAQHMRMAIDYPGLAPLIYLPQVALFFIVLGLLVAGVKRGVPLALLLYGCLSLLLCYTASWLISGGRYMLVVFPVYLVLARILLRRRALCAAYLISSAVLMWYYTSNFLLGAAVM